MTGAILVLNAGSSSLKFALHGDGPDLPRLLSGAVEELGGAARFAAKDASGAAIGARRWDTPLGQEGALAFLLDWLGEAAPCPVATVGHRVVHGGEVFVQPVRVDAAVLGRLEALSPLAPLHQPHNLRAIRVLAERRPDLPQVACFDTAFHATMPDLACAFALPPEITGRGIRRYGFHGLSYEYVASELPRHDPAAAAGRTIVLHLGNGASMCALLGGRSVATTMGFTALDGLPMGTRSGSLDPGVVLHLQRKFGMTADAVEDLLYRRSGLLGVSGVSSDMRTLLASDAPQARFAVDLFAYRIGRELGSLVAALGGLDAMIFTAGIGENAAPVRAAICRHAAWLGVALDAEANEGAGLRCISVTGSPICVWVVPTDEDLMIARHVARHLEAENGSSDPA